MRYADELSEHLQLDIEFKQQTGSFLRRTGGTGTDNKLEAIEGAAADMLADNQSLVLGKGIEDWKQPNQKVHHFRVD